MEVQISGEAAVVKKALFQIAAQIRDNPSRSQHLLASAVPGGYATGGPGAGAPIMGVAPFVVTGHGLCILPQGMKRL